MKSKKVGCYANLILEFIFSKLFMPNYKINEIKLILLTFIKL